MNEIYWITRFDSIHVLTLVLMIIGIIVSVITIIICIIANGQRIHDQACGFNSSAEENKGYVNTCRTILNYSLPLFIIACMFNIFVPTTKEALLIYGVGGTVDYIKSNPTAKQIPDKCIKALDKWVDSLGKEKTDSIDK